MPDRMNHLVRESIGTWGVHTQLAIVQEACAELIAAISWGKRHGQAVEELAEVAAGLELALASMRQVVGDEAVDAAVARKVESLDVDLCMYRASNQPLQGAA